jgi:hypothetical protein
MSFERAGKISDSVYTELRDWYFTFGCGQLHAGHYIIFHGTWESAREQMVENFGTNWCMQYPSAEAAGVERWGYKLLEVL